MPPCRAAIRSVLSTLVVLSLLFAPLQNVQATASMVGMGMTDIDMAGMDMAGTDMPCDECPEFGDRRPAGEYNQQRYAGQISKQPGTSGRAGQIIYRCAGLAPKEYPP